MACGEITIQTLVEPTSSYAPPALVLKYWPENSRLYRTIVRTASSQGYSGYGAIVSTGQTGGFRYRWEIKCLLPTASYTTYQKLIAWPNGQANIVQVKDENQTVVQQHPYKHTPVSGTLVTDSNGWGTFNPQDIVCLLTPSETPPVYGGLLPGIGECYEVDLTLEELY